MSEVASSYVSLMPSARGFGRNLSRQIGGQVDQVGSEQGKRFSRSFVSIAKGVLAGALIYQGLSKAASFAKGAIFDFNSTLQQSTIAFTSLLGSGRKARGFLGQLQQFAKATPFEFEGLVKNSQLMLGMGISAKNIIPYLTGLGDSVASVGGNADELNNTILAFSQINAKGKVSMDNLNQLLQGGVPSALKVLAAQFHVTTGKMTEMISAGQVSAKKALPLLIQGLEKGTSSTAALGGMMDKQSTTFSGALSNISDAMTQSIAGAFRPFFNKVSGGLQGLATFLSGPTFSRASKAFTSALSSGMSTVGDLIHALAPNVKAVFQGEVVPAFHAAVRIAGQVGAAIANIWPVIQPLMKDMRTVVVAAFQAFLKAAEHVGDALGPITKWIADNKGPILAVGHAIAQLGKFLAPLAPYAVAAFAGFKGAQAATSKVKDFASKVKNTYGEMKNFVVGAKNGISSVVTWIKYAKSGEVAEIQRARAIAATSLAWVKNTAATIANKTVSIASAAASKAMAAAQWLVNAAMEANPIMLVVTAIAALAAGLILAWKKSETFRKIVTAVFHAVKKVALIVFDWFVKKPVEAFAKMLSGFKTAFGKVKDFLGKWGKYALAVLAPFIAIPILIFKHWNQIKDFFVRVWNAIKGFISKWGKYALAVLAPFIAIPLFIFKHFNQIKDFLGRAFRGAMDTVKNWIGRIVDFVGGLPGKLARGAGKLFNAGRDLMGALFRGLGHAAGVVGDFAKAVVNKIIDGLNALIPHSLHIHIPIPLAPDVDFHLPLFPHIPHLARGGMTNGPMAAVIGDNRGGNELVAPMESPRTVKLLSKALEKAGGGGNSFTIYEATNARAVALEISRQQRMMGRI